MRKLNFKEILCGLLLSMCVVSITISCGRDNEDPKQEKTNPDTFSIGIQIADTEFSDGISNGEFAADTKYRAIVYREDGSYLMHNNYTIGASNENFSFNKKSSEKYTVVVYSFNSTKDLPAITDSEKGNIRTAVLDFDVNQGQIMYAKIDNYKLSKSENIKVKLKHMLIPFTLIVDNSATPSDFYKIQKVEYAKISNNQKGKISIFSGEVIERSDSQEQNLLFPVGTLPLGVKSSSTPVWLNVDKIANLIYKLKTDFSDKIGSGFSPTENRAKEKAENFEDKEISKSINVEQVAKYDEVITKQKCGAWISNSEFLEFMCQNLGATASSFDFIANLGHSKGFTDEHPSVNENALGAKYQWGKKEPILTQDDENKLNHGKIEWLYDEEKFAPVDDNSAWKGISKTELDPCPDGYRIPSVDEISSMYEYNKVITSNIEEKGSYIFSRKMNRGGKEYSINAVGFGYFLLLQTNGYRGIIGELNENEDNLINILVAGKPNDVTHPRSVRIGVDLTGKNRGLTVINHEDREGHSRIGLTVRCVKE